MRQETYRSYLLAVLMAMLASSFVDRMVLGLVLEDIKTDLDLTDTQLGILNGIAYAVFFSLMGIPMARWADRGNRVLVVSIATAAWSVAVAAFALAGSFLQLLLCRIGTAVGEAGCSPPANSLLPEYFPRGERPRAMARYLLGGPLGIMLGYFAGGWLNQRYGWRMTFLIIAVPGMILAVLAALTLKEPRRLGSAGIVARHSENPRAARANLKTVIMMIAATSSLRQMLLSWLLWCFCSWGMLQWLPTFLVRTHELTTGELGTWLAIVSGGGGLIATWLGGEWASRYAANNERLQLRIAAILLVISAGFYIAALLAPSHYWAMAALAGGVVAQSALGAPIMATAQTLMPAPMRATGLALIIMLPTFVGMGLGPSAVGLLSDTLQPWVGQESLRYALLLVCPGWCWAAWHSWRAGQAVLAEIIAVNHGSADGEEVTANPSSSENAGAIV
jgi:MFS transporter, Spinster family, sphingosine-1-phosphate transporter